MTATEAETGLSRWNNQRVTVVRNLPEPDADGNSTVEIEGLVQVGNEIGLLIKPKGKVTFDLIPADEIEDVFQKAEEEKKFKASKLKPVEDGKMRRHLLERHGVTLEWANSVTEEQATEYHNSLDHEKLDLGHVHAEPKDDDETAGDESTDDDAA